MVALLRQAALDGYSSGPEFQVTYDGNKRTAYVVCRTFLALNGVELVASAEDKYLSILALAESRLPAEAFAAWLRKHSNRNGPDQVQETRAGYRRAKA